MKLSAVAKAVAALLATDAKPTEAQIMAACIAADKKGKDEGGLGPVEIEKKAKDKAKDEDKDGKACDADKDDDKAEDADKDDPEHTNDEDPEMEGAEDDVQPAKTANGNSGAGGKEPAKDKAKDKKGMDAAVKQALDARDALHAARRDVETVLGVVAFDSAEDVYKAALVKLGVAVDGVHPSAYATLFRMKREAVAAATPVLGSDAAVVKSMAGAIKGYTRLP